MGRLSKLGGVATAALLTGTISASAAIVDFTDNSTGVSGALYTGVTWNVTSNTAFGLNTNEVGPGATGGVLAGQNDGFGVGNDEITYPTQYVTVTFSDVVTLSAAYFLDVFHANTLTSRSQIESANLSIGSTPGAVAGTAYATNPTSEGVGFASMFGNFKGTSFTFFAGPGKDDLNGDIALAAINVIPLPAGLLLMGTALGGLGLMRRKKKAA